MEEFKPGQVIAPQGNTPLPPTEPPTPPAGAPEPQRPAEQPEPAPTPSPEAEPEAAARTAAVPAADSTPAPTIDAGAPDQSPAPDAPWAFSPTSGSDAPAAAARPELPTDVSWTASEFIAHEKSASWYVLLAVAAIVVAVLVYLVTRDKISTGVVVLAALAFGAITHRKPRTQQYGLSRQGLRIGQKQYGFQEFKTFSVAEDGAIASIVFMPLKRFMPPLTIYVAPDMESQVVDFLSAVLPFQEHQADAVDSLLKRIRF